MAANDVLVASPATGTGGVLRAPLATALPTDASTALLADYVAQGYIGEDGVSMSTDRSVEKIRAWGGDSVRVVETEHDLSFSLTFLETNEQTLKAVFGDDNVTGSAGNFNVAIQSGALPAQVFVFDMIDGDKKVRIVVPNGQITEVGDTQFVHSDATGYEITIEAFADDSDKKAYIHYSNATTT